MEDEVEEPEGGDAHVDLVYEYAVGDFKLEEGGVEGGDEEEEFGQDETWIDVELPSVVGEIIGKTIYSLLYIDR